MNLALVLWWSSGSQAAPWHARELRDGHISQVEAIADNPTLHAFGDGATAAAVGAIAGAVFVLGRRAITDVWTTMILVVVFGILLSSKRIPEPALVAAAAIAGIIVRGG